MWLNKGFQPQRFGVFIVFFLFYSTFFLIFSKFWRILYCLICSEISLLKELKHPNIVPLQNVFFNRLTVTLLFDYIQLDLKTYIERLPSNFVFPQVVKQSYLHQIASAIAFCHSRRIFHRNLCSQNILITRKGVIKVFFVFWCSDVFWTFIRKIKQIIAISFLDHEFWGGAFIWSDSQGVYTLCDYFVVSITGGSTRHESVHAKNRHLGNRMHFRWIIFAQTNFQW